MKSTQIFVDNENERGSEKHEKLVIQIENALQINQAEMKLSYRVLYMKNHYQLIHSPLLIKSELVSGDDNAFNLNTQHCGKMRLGFKRDFSSDQPKYYKTHK